MLYTSTVARLRSHVKYILHQLTAPLLPVGQ